MLPTQFVVLPGLEGSGAAQEPLARQLEAFGPVYRFGYPHDTVRNYEQLLAELPWPTSPFVIVASSYGGPLALRAALTFGPKRVTSLVLIGSFASSPVPAGRLLAALAPLVSRGAPPRAAVRHMVGRHASDAFVDIAHQAVARVHTPVRVARLQEVLRSDLRSELPKLEQKTLYLRGKNDILVGGRGAKTLRALPNLTTRNIATGHFMSLSEPDACAREIALFLGLVR